MAEQEENYIYITDDRDLEKACKSLAQSDRLAVDTEFIGEKYYYRRVELLQLSAGNGIFLVDMQEVDNLKPLSDLLGNKNILKVFHAGSQDVEIIKRIFGVEPLPLFDTQIAAALLGYGAQISLSNLTHQLLRVKMSSKHSTSDWSHRPLSKAQLKYAADDVETLLDIHLKLKEALESKKRTHWFDDELKSRLENWLDLGEETPDSLFKRIKDWMSLSRQELALLRELAVWREQQAQSDDLPRKHVMPDEGLIEICRFQPRDMKAAQKARRIPMSKFRDHIKAIIACMDRAQKLSPDDWPEKPTQKRPMIIPGVLEICQALLRFRADEIGVASSILCTSSEMQSIVANSNWKKYQDFQLFRGWRREVVGEDILNLLEGKISLKVDSEGQLELNK